MKKICLLTVFVSIAIVGSAQSTNISTAFHGPVKKADRYFDRLAYRNALHIYLHANEKDPENIHIRERIAMCYFMLHDPENAEKWYATIVDNPDVHVGAKFEYAEALSMNGKYAESATWFESYLRQKPDDKMAQEKLAFLKKIHWYDQDSLRFLVANLPFNTGHSDYGAHDFHKGIVFASSRDTDVFVKHKPFDAVDEDESLLNLFYVEKEPNGDWTEPVPFHQEHMKTFFHEGPMAFYDNDRKGAFTRSNLKDGRPVYDQNKRVHLSIYFADVDELGSLSNITPFEHNNDGYSTAHPTFSNDGKTMIFSSTSPQGFGDSDIYYSTFENGKWTEPVNLGTNINTREDESFPFLANDSTLYFSSNGHGTMGGLDILVSYKRNGVWTKAQNFGGPLNSRFDDFSLVADSTGRVGYFSSNRPGGQGLDDIYIFIASYYYLAGKVKELNSDLVIPEAQVNVYDAEGKLVDTVTSDQDGGFRVLVPYDQDFTITGEKDGFETLGSVPFSSHGKPFGIDSLELPMWKQGLFAKGKVYSRETESILPGASVTLKNVTDGTEQKVIMNDAGDYVFLVKPDKNYRIEASKEGFVTQGFDLNTKGLYKGDLLNDIVLEEEFLSMQTIHFDYDKSVIKPEDRKKLDILVKVLKENPTFTLNIGAHADSRGTNAYNKSLSNRRAAATVNYFVSKGIRKSRIEATGFGEELLLNRCSDGVECPEEDHARNRRAEIKVQIQPIQ
jgi:outer membrane protein OmpA-like peptidoglycan-associated protein